MKGFFMDLETKALKARCQTARNTVLGFGDHPPKTSASIHAKPRNRIGG